VLDEILQVVLDPEVADEAVGLLLRGAVVIVSVAFSAVSTLLLSMLVLFFYLKDGTEMWNGVTSVVGGRAALLDRIGRRMWHAVRAFLIGTATVARKVPADAPTGFVPRGGPAT
jgi:predicted PurR-regulated permease PerM